jgi:ATP-dependent RNA helicase SUPV3L1/SUV3
MSQLLDVFVSICEIDNSKYFLCNYENIIYLASLIDHIPLKMSERYMFACTPVSRSNTFLVSSLVKFVRLYSSNEPIGVEEVTNIIDLPVEKANTPEKLKHLETIFDALDLYLWLGYRFPTMFPSMEVVKLMRKKLNDIIDQSLKDITKEKKKKKRLTFKIFLVK